MSYPSLNHKNYIESVYRFCEKNQFSMILKGSLAKDVATKYSDIDLIILGDITKSEVLLKYDKNYIVSDESVIRRGVTSDYMPNRPTWYRVLRLLHKGVIKYLSNKTDSAYNFLLEIKENLDTLNINNLKFNCNFEDDIQCIFNELCKRFEVDSHIKFLFYNLFKKF